MIESTIHAREWIAAATATYLLNELLTSTDTTIQDLARNFNWIIIPVLNVDGYVYSHERVSKYAFISKYIDIYLCAGIIGSYVAQNTQTIIASLHRLGSESKFRFSFCWYIFLNFYFLDLFYAFSTAL